MESKDFYVENPLGEIIKCNLPGKFKKKYELKKDKQFILDVAVVGDKVDYRLNKDSSGTIVKIFERRNYLSRKAPRMKGASFRGERLEQLIAANLDNIVIVNSIKEPRFNNRLLDRIIVAGESSKVNVLILINKIDLDITKKYEKWVNLYSKIGYKVFPISIISDKGLDNLKIKLHDSVSLFWGQSGVGKSSLLNKLYPTLDLKTGSISRSSKKGIHTTVTVSMEKVDKETYVIDTPGMREIDPYGIKKTDLGHYFLDFQSYLNNCRFNSCIHQHEPECDINKLVSEGKISTERYKSYLNLLETVEEDIIF
ncbi:ribosome small subunit-dependent GTPase A [Bacteroidota bacterium]